MILYIDTTKNNLVEIGLKDKNKFIAKKKINSNHTQAEKLLPGIAKLLKTNRLKLSDLKSLAVVNQGGSFTSLRIGVVTANALGYALSIPVAGSHKGKNKKFKNGKLSFNLLEPGYSSKPIITAKKQIIFSDCGKDVKN